MDAVYLDLALLVLLLAAVFALIVWWGRHKERKEQREHTEALTALAGQLGGTVSGPDNATAWSAGLLQPFKNDSEGLLNRLGTARRPRFELALDFVRGPWQVRVTEASMKKNVGNGTRAYHEHRIEVVTGQLTPVKIARRLHADFLGRPLKPGHVLTEGTKPIEDPPATVAQQRGEWQRLRLPMPADQEFAVFATDMAAAHRMLGKDALEHMVANAGSLPPVFTFEAGLFYATMLYRISPDTLLTTVDAVLGLLERIPGAAPAPHTQR
ncbi:hypothetical protein ACFS2C_00565 [Prauserella oleivorans]|uniref:Uncharacterized protein n=1 Tax=Prauserella oleivorans TaxID=1478153 RepID=A0ABW5W3U2_9PSEU